MDKLKFDLNAPTYELFDKITIKTLREALNTILADIGSLTTKFSEEGDLERYEWEDLRDDFQNRDAIQKVIEYFEPVS